MTLVAVHNPMLNERNVSIMVKDLILVTTVLAVVLSGCSGAASGGGAAAPQEITVTASDFKFEPEEIAIAANRPVKIVLQNAGAVEHDWSIMEIPVVGVTESGDEHSMGNTAQMPDVHVAAMHGQSGHLEFTPTAPGTYAFWCTVPGHKETGMVGKLVVKSP